MKNLTFRGEISQKTNKEEGLCKKGGLDSLQSEGERKAFLGGSKKGSDVVRLPPRAHGCHKRRKNLTFSEISGNPTPPLFFITPPYR